MQRAPSRPTKAQQAARERIVKALGETGFVLPGTLIVEAQRCGKTNCRCHSDPPTLHGPYARWTRKLDNKTVTRNLSEEELEAYRPYFENAKRVRALVIELQELTLEMIETSETMATRQRRTGVPRRV